MYAKAGGMEDGRRKQGGERNDGGRTVHTILKVANHIAM